MRIKHIIYIVALGIITVACSGTRNLSKPNIDIPSTIGHISSDSSSVADVDWRTFYTDTILRSMIQTALDNNRDIAIAAARVKELSEMYGVAKLNYLPDITAVVGGTYETNDYKDDKSVRDPEVDFKATLNWEIDLWGGLSASRRKAGATYLGAVEDDRAMRITIIAEVATAYYNLVALRNELAIVRQTLLTREQALEKSRLRYEGGLTSELTYQQAKVELATTASLVPGLQRRITLAENALNLLMGRLPDSAINIDIDAFDESLPELIPTGVPSTLLERRPDIRSAEQALKAALADVGVSYSNQFPRLRIALTGGWENDDVKGLFESPFSYVLGNIAGTIFDFGKKQRKYRASIQAYEQARFRYEKAVLAAFSEVDGAVTTYDELRQTAQLRTELRDAAGAYVNLANKQYNGGTINYIDVLDAHRRYFDARISLSNALRDEKLALVALYKVLGGGWIE